MPVLCRATVTELTFEQTSKQECSQKAHTQLCNRLQFEQLQLFRSRSHSWLCRRKGLLCKSCHQ